LTLLTYQGMQVIIYELLSSLLRLCTIQLLFAVIRENRT